MWQFSPIFIHCHCTSAYSPLSPWPSITNQWPQLRACIFVVDQCTWFCCKFWLQQPARLSTANNNAMLHIYRAPWTLFKPPPQGWPLHTPLFGVPRVDHSTQGPLQHNYAGMLLFYFPIKSFTSLKRAHLKIALPHATFTYQGFTKYTQLGLF